MKLHHYMLGYLSVGIIVVLTAWVVIFYAFMTDEVYDNIDDGLKNSKTEIIKKAYANPQVESFLPFGTNGFRITPLEPGEYSRKNVFSTEMIYMDADDNDEPVRMLTTTFIDQKGNPYLLEIRTSTIEADDLLRDFGLAVFILYLALLVSIYLINHILLKRAVWSPFYRLLHNLKTYTLGQRIVTPETQTPIKEFTDLQREINKMIERIEDMVEQQKTFVSNAAHESQTPLAIINNKLELLVEAEDLNEHQINQIQSIHQSLTRLIKLNKSLLMLAKIENKQFVQYQEVNLNQIVKDLVEDWEDILAYKQLEVTINETPTSSTIFMDKGLAITLVQNLLKNAIAHNTPNGQIVIDLQTHAFSIRNTSTVKVPLDESLIYNRFYRSTTNEESTGLGLALVQTIIKVTPLLSIHYEYNGMHCFSIRW
ncbi:HAMP domain-containing histidine kinase [Myroides sp. 1354]|nr:HAMP domain-containing histidine kinase [Myroides sp. R163-1]MDM1056772.1 HAMP domain-containing histidine kinase [Myroides sp. 1354]MDM1069957.1 HAMP domain-containing histidine kinase [Myroides sp. 1372]